LLARYDQQLARDFTCFPVKPPNPYDKRRTKQHPATNLLCRLHDFKTEVWRFLTDWQVPFDNNCSGQVNSYQKPKTFQAALSSASMGAR